MEAFMANGLGIVKSLHIVGVVVWFAGLFYIARLYVYHKELDGRSEQEKAVLEPQFSLMERRLWYAITWPGMIVTVVMGSSLLIWFGFPPWIHAKLGLVVLLLLYHLQCGRLRKQLVAKQCTWSSKKLRMFNEVPSVLLVMIVFAVVMKNQLSWPIFMISMLGFVLVMGVGFKIYSNVRKKNKVSEESR